MDMQRLVDMMGDARRQTRSEYHLTLGKAIEFLAKASRSYVVVFDYNNHSPGEEMSYRGYYSDLSFETNDSEPKTVDEFDHQLNRALGQEYTGYKGGEFLMGLTTPLWQSPYGTTGRAIVGIRNTSDGTVELITKVIDD